MSEIWKHRAKRAIRRSRLLLLGTGPAPINRSGWQSRILLINLAAIGDLVVFTSTLKHYKKAFPDKKIFLLMSGVNGCDPALLRPYVDEIILINPKQFNIDIRYGYRLVKQLRKIGFATIIEHNPHLEWSGKAIATELGAERTVAYGGLIIDNEHPVSATAARDFAYIKKRILPRYTDIVPNTIEKWRMSDGIKYVPHIINHHIKIFEHVSSIHQAQENYASQLIIENHEFPAVVKTALMEGGIQENHYCLLSLTAGLSEEKEWEIEKYAAMCDYLASKNIPVVLIGTKKDAERKKRFPGLVKHPVVNLTGTTSIMDVTLLAKNCLFTFSNETSVGHMAIALKKPCMVVMGAWNPGLWTFYGYEDINRWVYQKNAPCVGDNGQCVGDRSRPAPCVTAITTDEVQAELKSLLDHLENGSIVPQKKFALDFGK